LRGGRPINEWDPNELQRREQHLLAEARAQARTVRVLASACILILLLALLLCFTSSSMTALGATVVAMVFLAMAWNNKSMLRPYAAVISHRTLRDLDYFVSRATVLAILLALFETGVLLFLMVAAKGNPMLGPLP
jgi:hypothetical protein